MIYIGIDNGVTGTICVLDGESRDILHWCPTPVRQYKSYTGNGRFMNRIDRKRFVETLTPYVKNSRAILENPMFHPDPRKFHASISAAMSLEAEWTLMENMGIPYSFIAAITWQKVLIKGVKKGETKKAGMDVAAQLFPNLVISAGHDADAVLIAEYARRMNL